MAAAAPLSTALHFYHSDSVNANAWNVTVRRLVSTDVHGDLDVGLDAPDITIDGATITAPATSP